MGACTTESGKHGFGSDAAGAPGLPAFLLASLALHLALLPALPQQPSGTGTAGPLTVIVHSRADEPAAGKVARAEPARVEAARTEAARTEAARTEAARTEAARTEAARTEAARAEAARAQAAQVEATTARGDPTTAVLSALMTTERRETGREELLRSVRGSLQRALDRHFSYPLAARRRGWEGNVRVQLTVEPDGDLRDIRVLETSGHRLLDRSALADLEALGSLPELGDRLAGEDLVVDLPVQYRLSVP